MSLTTAGLASPASAPCSPPPHTPPVSPPLYPQRGIQSSPASLDGAVRRGPALSVTLPPLPPRPELLSPNTSPSPKPAERTSPQPIEREIEMSPEAIDVSPEAIDVPVVESARARSLSPVERPVRPPLVRKKSGELVKSSLKLPTLQRVKSEPNTKTVHFDSNRLVHVRKFSRAEQPAAVSRQSGRRAHFQTADSEYNDDDDDEVDDDFDDDDDDDDDDDSFSLDDEWTLETPGFAPNRHQREPAHKRPIVYLDRLGLSADNKSLQGHVLVRNLSFSKSVTVRYTIDDWRSLSEVDGHWSSDIRKRDRDEGYDLFEFSIPLNGFHPATLASSKMFLCVRYRTDGQEFWDSNDGKNYEVLLRNECYSRSLPKRHGRHRRRSQSEDLRASPDPIDFGFRFRDGDSESELIGVPLRSKKQVNKRSEFQSRYSFAAAYSSPPKSKASLTPVNRQVPPAGHTIQTEYQRKAFVGKGSQPAQTKIGPVNNGANNGADNGTNTGTTSSVNGGTNNGTAHMGKRDDQASVERVFGVPQTSLKHSWQSDSYQDLLSRYCFYTPQGSMNLNQASLSSSLGSSPPSGELSPTNASGLRSTIAQNDDKLSQRLEDLKIQRQHGINA